MTFHFKQEDGDPLQGLAILGGDEFAQLLPCPQCDRPSPTYGHVGNAYFVECPKCCLRMASREYDPRSIRCLRNAVRYHKRALLSAVSRWNERAAAKGEVPWPKMNPPIEEPPFDHMY